MDQSIVSWSHGQEQQAKSIDPENAHLGSEGVHSISIIAAECPPQSPCLQLCRRPKMCFPRIMCIRFRIHWSLC